MPANAPASLNRAFSIIEATAEIRGRPKISDRTLKEHWKEWRGIAPLSAALQAWEMQRPSGNQANYARSQALMTKQGISSLLMWAKWFRWFATTFTPHKGQGVLIPEREAVIYNVALSEEMPPLPPLRQFEMEAAMRYHAPTLKSGY